MGQQLTLNLEQGLSTRYRDMRECFATCVYQRGLSKVAAAVDCAPSNLSQMLSGDRHLDPEVIERYMREFGDRTPALFWAAKWCDSVEDQQARAMAELPAALTKITELLALAQGGR